MNKTDTGGKAFPHIHEAVDGGMTLLDYFAGQAMQSLVSVNPILPTVKDEDLLETMAAASYLVADAMIAEKRRRESQPQPENGR